MRRGAGRQVLSNGAVKERNRELSEKFRSDETPAQAPPPPPDRQIAS